MKKINKNEVTIEVVSKQIMPLVEEVKSMTISDAADMKKSVDMLSRLNVYLDGMVAEKKLITDPINAALKEVESRYKPTETLVKSSIEIIRDAQSKYQTEMTKKADAEAAKIADRVGEGKGKLKLETAVAQIGELDRPDARIDTGAGSVSFRKTPILKVVDAAKVPREYLIIDEAMVLNALKAGINVPGCELDIKMIPFNKR